MEAVAYDVSPEDEVRNLIEGWRKAAVAKDVDAILLHYAPDIVAFDAIAQLRFRGRDAYRKHWEACLSMCPGQMIFEVHDLNIAAGGDLAFCHYLSLCGGTGENGEAKTGWMRATAGCRKIDGKWMIVHEHFSAPFEIESGKALFDLQP
jgi:uncharacterized protein (TIGR02246 family)